MQILPKLPSYQITRFLHTGLWSFGLSAWLTSEWADSYKEANHLGFTIHSWLGMGLVFFVCLRFFYGFIGSPNVRFSQMLPYTQERLTLIGKDVVNLLTFQLPISPTYQGLAGTIKLLGLLLFSWMAVTGSFMFFLLEPGTKARGFVHSIMELHEVGEVLIPIYLVLHIGIILFYAIKGRDLWRKMFFLK